MSTRFILLAQLLLIVLSISCSTPYYRLEIGASPTPTASVTLTATPAPTTTPAPTATPVLPTQTPFIIVVTATPIPLPSELTTADGRAALFEKIRVPFNNKDNYKLYVLFDPLMQQQMSKAQFDQQLVVLYPLAGTIESAAYAQYDYKGIMLGKKIFEIQYFTTTSRGKGLLRITIAQEDDGSYSLWGFQLPLQ
jgi:hypothetical protein